MGIRKLFVLWLGCIIGGALSALFLVLMLSGFEISGSLSELLGAVVMYPIPAAIFSIPGLLTMIVLLTMLDKRDYSPIEVVDALALGHLVISIVYLVVFTFGKGMQGMDALSSPFLGFGMLLWIREMWLVRRVNVPPPPNTEAS